MIRKSSRILLIARDVVVLLVSIVLMGTTYGKWVSEPVFLVIFGVATILLVLSLVDVLLTVLKAERRGFFRANSVFQLILGLFFLGLEPVLGILLLALSILVLVSLGEKKSLEEQPRNPPVPITRNYRIDVAVGLLAMLASMLIPAVSTSDNSASVFGIYVAIARHSGLPGVSLAYELVIFAILGILLPPVSLISGGLALLKRRFSAVAGTLSIVAGASLVIALTSSAGPGAYGFILAGGVFLLGYFGFQKDKHVAHPGVSS